MTVSGEVFFPEDADNRDIRIYAVSLLLENELRPGLLLIGAVGPTVTRGVFVRDEDPEGLELDSDRVGLGTAGFIRWRPARRGGIAPFVELAFGMLFTTRDFPPDGTPWNFNQRYGVGLDVQVSPRISLAVAYRHLHVSNGKGLVPENPSYDGDGLMLGIVW